MAPTQSPSRECHRGIADRVRRGRRLRRHLDGPGRRSRDPRASLLGRVGRRGRRDVVQPGPSRFSPRAGSKGRRLDPSHGVDGVVRCRTPGFRRLEHLAEIQKQKLSSGVGRPAAGPGEGRRRGIPGQSARLPTLVLRDQTPSPARAGRTFGPGGDRSGGTVLRYDDSDRTPHSEPGAYARRPVCRRRHLHDR